MNISDKSDVKVVAYHAHIYFENEDGLKKAKILAQQADEQFQIRVGRFHEKKVGPHPKWSCQLSFLPEEYGKLIPWLMLNRQDLDIFVHFVSGDDYFDHTQGVSWLGNAHQLDLTDFDEG